MIRLNTLEHSISRGDVKEQKLHIYHQLASFWADSAGKFAPAAWYTAEAARLENSEKSLTFAAHLLLNNLVDEASPLVKQWEAFQAKDLFERSLKLNPDNDSSRVGLGAVYVYGGFAMSKIQITDIGCIYLGVITFILCSCKKVCTCHIYTGIVYMRTTK